MINESGIVLSHPGLLAAYPDSFARFEKTATLAAEAAPPDGRQDGRQKLTLAAEEIWHHVWCEQAPIGLIIFPHIAGGRHQLSPLSPPETLRRLLPHAIEQWDKAMMPAHLACISRLVEAAPGYTLALGPNVQAIPSLLAHAISNSASTGK
jgi:hypothetical protein